MLIPLGHLCDNNCIAVIDKHDIRIIIKSEVIIKGEHNRQGILWDIPINKPIHHRDHAIITRDKTKTKVIQCIHGCCFSTPPRNFLQAIKNANFISWPELSSNNILCFLPHSIATALGYLDQERENLKSTIKYQPLSPMRRIKSSHKKMNIYHNQ